MILFRHLTLIIAIPLCQPVTSIAQLEVAANNNAFTLAFYREWSKHTDKNIVLSPFSITAAVAMIYPGARNATAHQMKRAMHFHGTLEQHNHEFHTLLTKISPEGSPMVIANTLWIQKGFKIESEFLDVNAQFFGSNFREADFEGAPDSARMMINVLIEKQTKDKIKNLLPWGSINPMTRLVLTNAIYFKDAWTTPFDPMETKERDFFPAPGNPVKTKFMEQRNVIFKFFENDLVTIVDLSYRSGKFSMLVMLPKGSGVDTENFLMAGDFSSWEFIPGKFRTLRLPKFRIDHEMQPPDILKRFGMTDAFREGEADFSGIAKEPGLFISGIFHKAFIEVNEEGTEAAASTAVVAQTESAIEPQKEMDFIANKPFLFLIRDRLTNSIVFIGKVTDPTQ